MMSNKKTIYEELSRIKQMMVIKEEEIQITKDPNTMLFFHGGDLDNINSDIEQKTDRQKFGSGLYLTTRYEVVQKYIKGSRKFYLVSVKPGTDIDTVDLPWSEVQETLISIGAISRKGKVDINPRFVVDNEISASIINNYLINNNLLKPKVSAQWRNYLVSKGIDYELVENAFGWGETMMVLYNTNLINGVKQIQAKDRLSTYDLKKI